LNGSIDEVLIFNRSLSAAEISALYNASANQYFNNFTGLADGVHTFTGHAVDIVGNRNSTDLRTVTIESTNVWIANILQPFDNATAWSTGMVPFAGQDVILNGSGTGDVNITNNTLPQNLKSFTVDTDYPGILYFNALFASGSWGSYGAVGTQNWNVTENIVINNGTAKIYGSFVGNSTDSPGYNLTDGGEGQHWRSLNGNITIGENATLDGNGLGFPEDVGPGIVTGGSGGSHGGKGAFGGGGPGPSENLYGNASAPTSLGSGGPDKPGGSAIKLEANEAIVLHGKIKTLGDCGTNQNCGAGGSIWLIAKNISGSGDIDASGGDLSGARGGGGGRIRLEYGSFLELSGTISVSGGHHINGPGLHGSLTFTNNTWPGDWNLTGSIGLLGGDFGDGEVIQVLGDFNTNDYNITVYGDCFYDITNPVTCFNTTADGKGVWINASGNITISAASILDGVELGFPAGAGPGFLSSGGGSYGGKGGGTSAQTYGNETAPTSLGSGGSDYQGGSAFRLESSDKIIVDGKINMQAIFHTNGRVGSGGSIWLKATNISGVGFLNATGGSATTYYGGGGGRIALTSSDVIEFSGVIENQGGIDTNGPDHGSGGTVYINATTSIIDSGNITVTGLNGSYINFTAPLLTLSGIYNASSINLTAGNNGNITTNYTSCSSTFTGTFDPARIDEGPDECNLPTVSFVSPTPANASTQSNPDIYVNLSTTDSSDHYAFVDFDDSLVLWMRMDDVNSSGDPTDLSSYSNNGTLINATINSTGYFGNASHFDGTGDYIDTDFIWYNNSQITVVFWNKVNTNQVQQSSAFGASTNLPNRVQAHVPWNDNTLYWDYGEIAGDGRISTGYGAYLDNWTHVALVSEGNGGSFKAIYLNGVQITNSTVSDGPNIDITSGIDIGFGLSTYYHNGSIDEFLIFNRSLSAVEIAALYNATATQYQNNFTGLSEGDHTFTGHAVDIVGNRNSTDLRTVTIETTNVWIANILQPFDNATAWSTGMVPFAGQDVIFNGSGTGDVNITNNTLPQNLKSFTVEGSYGSGTIYFETIFAVGNWTGDNTGTQLWNVTNNIVINNGTMKIYGDFQGNSTDSTCCNITEEGHGQEWRSVSGNITVGSEATLDGVGLGFPVDVGPGTDSGSQGATHGGRGASSTKDPYGNASAPVSLGSAGTSTLGEAGGSGIKLEANAGVIDINGIINISGLDGGSRRGAGGSIWLKADNISGTGTVIARGGDASAGTGGGGGRIRLEYISALEFTGTVSVIGGTETIGTALPGTLTFTNNTWPTDWNLTDNTGLLGGDFGDGDVINVLGNFNTNDYNMTIYGDCFYNATNPVVCYNTTADGKGVWLNASGNITISSASILDGDNLGFPTNVGPGSSQEGGTYGGKGGDNTIDEPYGNETAPTSLGSGASTSIAAGGSAIKLETRSGTINMSGVITMIGSGGPDAGSGGSIWLTASNIIGDGNLSATGGLAASRGGGGGRIALISDGTVNFSGNIENKGGVATNLEDGGGGTVYINATTSVTFSGNISVFGGRHGGYINFTDTLLTLSGIFNASTNFSMGESSGNITTNYTSCSSTFTGTFDPARIDEGPVCNTAPEIILVTNISNQDPSEDTTKAIVFNFTAFDADGATELVNASAEANFSFSGTGETDRINTTCVQASLAGDYANYTCTIEMQYFDAFGDWNITVKINDSSDAQATNDTTAFQYNQLTAIKISPTSLSFDVEIGAFNQTSTNDPTVINNTGNYNVTALQINASDLYGEDDTSFNIPAANFSVDIDTGGAGPAECDGTLLVNRSTVNITGALLPVGNHSVNDNSTGQETLFYCITQVPAGIPSQSYSTLNGGSWIIKIILAAFVPRVSRRRKDELKKRKRKKDQIFLERTKRLLQDHDIADKDEIFILMLRNLKVPTSIFTQDLGGLEALCKYLKENVGTSYHEIAIMLHRNDRTIWTSYQKARKKHPQSIKPRIKDLKIPLVLFMTKKLTILESMIVYFKDTKHLSYSEIAKLVSRDQRNVWTIYSRAVIKIRKKI